MADDKYLAARLLSGRNRLSSIEKDDILNNVLRVENQQKPAKFVRWLLASGLAAALGGLLLLFYFPQQQAGQFTSKGDGLLAQGFSISCLADKGTDTCSQGSKLLFRTWPVTGKPYFSALARAEDGTVIWYFPSTDVPTSLDTRTEQVKGVLKQAVMIGVEHGFGSYTVYGLFSAQALSKDEIRDRLEGGDELETSEITVFTQKMMLSDKP